MGLPIQRLLLLSVLVAVEIRLGGLAGDKVEVPALLSVDVKHIPSETIPVSRITASRRIVSASLPQAGLNSYLLVSSAVVASSFLTA